jgi:SNF family Na+-dependent transporter
VGNGGSVLSDAKVPRPRWGSTSEFILAAVGSAVGLGNLLRFPHMVYKHGGLAFLVPYALAVVFLGVPVLAMELALGQVAQAGCVDALAAMHGRAWGIGGVLTRELLLRRAGVGVVLPGGDVEQSLAVVRRKVRLF